MKDTTRRSIHREQTCKRDIGKGGTRRTHWILINSCLEGINMSQTQRLHQFPIQSLWMNTKSGTTSVSGVSLNLEYEYRFKMKSQMLMSSLKVVEWSSLGPSNHLCHLKSDVAWVLVAYLSHEYIEYQFGKPLSFMVFLCIRVPPPFSTSGIGHRSHREEAQITFVCSQWELYRDYFKLIRQSLWSDDFNDINWWFHIQYRFDSYVHLGRLLVSKPFHLFSLDKICNFKSTSVIRKSVNIDTNWDARHWCYPWMNGHL